MNTKKVHVYIVHEGEHKESFLDEKEDKLKWKDVDYRIHTVKFTRKSANVVAKRIAKNAKKDNRERGYISVTEHTIDDKLSSAIAVWLNMFGLEE